MVDLFIILFIVLQMAQVPRTTPSSSQHIHPTPAASGSSLTSPSLVPPHPPLADFQSSNPMLFVWIGCFIMMATISAFLLIRVNRIRKAKRSAPHIMTKVTHKKQQISRSSATDVALIQNIFKDILGCYLRDRPQALSCDEMDQWLHSYRQSLGEDLCKQIQDHLKTGHELIYQNTPPHNTDRYKAQALTIITQIMHHFERYPQRISSQKL